jgi:molybdopterin molybdotransferase
VWHGRSPIGPRMLGNSRGGSSVIDVREADQILAAHSKLRTVCECSLSEARGRVLREDIRADRNQPPYHRVTMDGIAVSAAAVDSGIRRFRLRGVQAAGQRALEISAPEECVEVMTGAVLPEGCDAVVRVEDVELDGDVATIHDGVHVRSRQNVHIEGSDARAGEVVVPKGTRLAPPHIAIAAAMGSVTLLVGSLPGVAVISTGDELVAETSEVEDHQIRRSNVYAIQAALRTEGVEEIALCHLPDDKARLASELARLLDRFDILVLSGGVSMGKFDFVPEVLEELGVERHIHKVRQRPGKPMWFGNRLEKSVFALPGNPVSSLTCLYRYVLPYLRRAAGEARPAPARVSLSVPVKGLPNLTRFLPVVVESAVEDGPPLATAVETNTSGDFLSLGRSDGFVEIAESLDSVPAGSALPYYPWRTA